MIFRSFLPVRLWSHTEPNWNQEFARSVFTEMQKLWFSERVNHVVS